MKSVDKSKLHVNSLVNIFKYVVLLLCFLFLCVFEKEIAKAADCGVEYSYNTKVMGTDCDSTDTYTHVNNTEIGIPVYFRSAKKKHTVGGSVTLKICAKGSYDGCKDFTLFNQDKETNITAVHFTLSKVGGKAYYKYQISGSWVSDMNEYVNTGFTDFLNSYLSSTYASNGFRIVIYANVYKESTKLVCSGYSETTNLPTNCSYKTVYDRTGDVKGGWDVDSYYLRVHEPEINITELDGTEDVKESYKTILDILDEIIVVFGNDKITIDEYIKIFKIGLKIS